MERQYTSGRPKLRTKKFSTLHIEIFEQILISGKTNWDLNRQFGYTKRSWSVVRHSRRVMYKLLALENLKREEYKQKVIFPRESKFWWKRLLDKHRPALLKNAVTALYYETMPEQADKQIINYGHH
jgi:hypothetical protein